MTMRNSRQHLRHMLGILLDTSQCTYALDTDMALFYLSGAKISRRPVTP